MMVLPNPLSLVDELRELAEARPTVYYRSPAMDGGKLSGCHYSAGVCSDGTIGCAIGQAIAAGDWPDISAAELDALRSSHAGLASISRVYDIIAPGVRVPGEQAAIDWLQAFQDDQDNGSSWGECVAFANEIAGDSLMAASYAARCKAAELAARFPHAQ